MSKLKRLLYYESQHQSQSNEKSLVQFDYEKAVSNCLGTQSTFNPPSPPLSTPVPPAPQSPSPLGHARLVERRKWRRLVRRTNERSRPEKLSSGKRRPGPASWASVGSSAGQYSSSLQVAKKGAEGTGWVLGLPSHDIGITNLIWCMAYKREVGGGIVWFPVVVQ